MNLEHAGHNWSIRKVACELRLICGDALDANSAFSRDVFEDFINQKEGIAMRKDFSDVGVHKGLRKR